MTCSPLIAARARAQISLGRTRVGAKLAKAAGAKPAAGEGSRMGRGVNRGEVRKARLARADAGGARLRAR